VKKAIPYTIKIERLGQPKPMAGGKETKNPPNEFTLIEKDVVNAPAADTKEGVEVPITIKFEPSSMNESKSLLTITNPEGGQYQYYLLGQSLSPQPKGPYKSTGKGINIEFKNPFYETTEYMVRIDNPSFTTSVKNPWKLDVISV
jgi:hydrocephalus-inducing protein